MCQGGNSRSVALGYVLKYELGIDALACSWEKNTPETRDMLCRWADRIIVMQSMFVDKVPLEFYEKVTVYDVGEDRWFNSLHPELLGICQGMVHVDPYWRPN